MYANVIKSVFSAFQCEDWLKTIRSIELPLTIPLNIDLNIHQFICPFVHKPC